MASEFLNLQNFSPANIVETSRLASDANASQAILTAQNADGFVTDDFVGIEVGNELGEIRRVLSVAGQAITVTTNLTFKHLATAKLVKLRGDKIKLYRAANSNGSAPADNSFTAYPGTSPTNPITIQADQFTTPVTDPSGGSDYWYKQVYFNSITSAETDVSLSTAVRGGDYGHYVTLDEIRREAGFTNNQFITDDDLYNARESAESEINGALSVSGYTLPLTSTVPVLRVIAKILAAGYLLNQDYGAGAEGTNKEGAAKKKEARELLTAIRVNNIVLVDETGMSLAQSDSPSGIPDTSTVEATDDPRPPVFTMADRF